jgi:hypothetical protein
VLRRLFASLAITAALCGSAMAGDPNASPAILSKVTKLPAGAVCIDYADIVFRRYLGPAVITREGPSIWAVVKVNGYLVVVGASCVDASCVDDTVFLVASGMDDAATKAAMDKLVFAWDGA